MTLAFLCDHNIEGAITRELRRRGIDVLAAREDLSHERSDSSLLDRALALHRVLITHDRDFIDESARRQAAGEPFSGVVFVPPRLAVGSVVTDILIIAGAGTITDARNALFRLPL